MPKFLVGDTVRIIDRKLQSFGLEFVVTQVWGMCVYHGKQWNDERELQLVSRPTLHAPDAAKSAAEIE